MELDFWAEDRLDRAADAAALLGFLNSRLEDRTKRQATISYVLNLDAQWGQGKSFFLERVGRELLHRGHIVAPLNAWETDFSDDPLVALLSAVDEAVQPLLRTSSKLKRMWKGVLSSGGTLAASLAKNVAAKAASRYAGDFLDQVSDEVGFALPVPTDDEDDPTGVETGVTQAVEKLADAALEKVIAPFRQQARSIQLFRQQLAKISVAARTAQGAQRRLFVLIDELDRCRPTYAIKMLESVKHMFNTDNVVFIIATDTAQLSESVKAVYGTDFDAKRYLRRFFDRSYRFKQPSRQNFIASLLNTMPIDVAKLAVPNDIDLAHMCMCYADAFNLSLRDIEQCFDALATVTAVWPHKVQIQLPHMLALIIANHTGDQCAYEYLIGAPGPMSEKIKFNDVIIRSYRVRANNDAGFTETKLRINNFIAAYRKYIDIPLHGVEPDRSQAESFVSQKLIEELGILYNNRFSYESPYYSVIRDYPKFVELAVQFDDYEQNTE